MLTREQGQALVEQVLGMSRADDVQVSLRSTQTTHLRFARNTPSTSGTATDTVLSIESTFGTRSATATINQLDPASLAEGVSRSEALARLAPEDPEHMPSLGAQSFPLVEVYDGRVQSDAAPALVEGSGMCMERARARNLEAAGYSQAVARATFIGTKHGLFGYHRTTETSFSMTARSAERGGSGWASTVGNTLASLDYDRCSATAVDKALRSEKPRPLAPGKYVTILEPACVANLMQLLASSMNARSADEGRSYFSEPGGGTKLGRQLFPEAVTLRSDPAAADAPAAPWGEGGLPHTPRTWIDRGRLATLACERFWAQKKGREAVAPPSNVLMTGGSGALSELVSSTKRGVLISSLWYIRAVDPRTLLFTGLTRDGVFWIENGQIAYPVTNFRWNDSPIAVLQNLEAMTASVRTSTRDGAATNIFVPALRVRAFELSSVSDAV